MHKKYLLKKSINQPQFQPSLKKGDKVVMINCGEAGYYNRKEWICRTDSFLERYGQKCEVVFLENFTGYFLCSCLEKSFL